MKSEQSGADRRKYPRRGCGYIIDYQLMEEETENLARRASTVNVSAQGLCICSKYMENPNDVLLLSLPYITPNPGIVAAKIKYTVKSKYNLYYHGLFILPLFQERFSVVESVAGENESIELPLETGEMEGIKKICAAEELISPVVEGICRFWKDISPRIEEKITSFDDLTEFLSKEIRKRKADG